MVLSLCPSLSRVGLSPIAICRYDSTRPARRADRPVCTAFADGAEGIGYYGARSDQGSRPTPRPLLIRVKGSCRIAKRWDIDHLSLNGGWMEQAGLDEPAGQNGPVVFIRREGFSWPADD